MVDLFEMQRRYYTAKLEQYSTKPELNRAKIKDCEYYLGMLEESGSSEEFMIRVKEAGNMVSSAKAESTDRYRNRLLVFEKLGEQKKAEEDRLRLALIESAENHVELSEKLEKFETETRLSFNENKAVTALGTVMSAVFQLATDGAGSADGKRSRANAEAGAPVLSPRSERVIAAVGESPPGVAVFIPPRAQPCSSPWNVYSAGQTCTPVNVSAAVLFHCVKVVCCRCFHLKKHRSQNLS
jgi:hypothetical protein